MKNVYAMYFSPTGTTKKVSETIGKTIAGELFAEFKTIDFTPPKNREKDYHFTSEDLVVFAVPVYAGRVPNVLLKFMDTIKGETALAVPVVLFGNRNFDNALMELKTILANKNFKVVGAAAFVGEHSFSKILGAGRPDSEDIKIAEGFGKTIAEKIESRSFEEFYIKGENPSEYYKPLDNEGKFIDIKKVKPKTKESCTYCGICSQVCPMGSIPKENPFEYTGICIKCGACIKKCPVEAKYYDDEGYLFHKEDLEKTFTRRAEIELFM